jgi:uncharacterized protein (AIM24 family)
VAQLSADKRVLIADLHGDRIRAANGSMVAFEGDVEFRNAGMGGGGGMRAALKRAVAGESISLMTARVRDGSTWPRTHSTSSWST